MSSRRDQISAGMTRYLRRCPSPLVTRRDAVRLGQRRERRRGGAAAGSEFFEDVEGDYYDGLQNEDGKDRIAPGSAVLHPHQTWGGGMTDTALAMLTVGIAASHLHMHRRELW